MCSPRTAGAGGCHGPQASRISDVEEGLNGMPRLTPNERAWLKEYRQALDERHPDAVVRMLLYGSKARGDAHSESDLDVLLVVRTEAAHLKRSLRGIGYELAATTDAVPSILAYTEKEWRERKEKGYPFQQAVERDAVSVL